MSPVHPPGTISNPVLGGIEALGQPFQETMADAMTEYARRHREYEQRTYSRIPQWVSSGITSYEPRRIHQGGYDLVYKRP